jgi:hypothetical protein
MRPDRAIPLLLLTVAWAGALSACQKPAAPAGMEAPAPAATGYAVPPELREAGRSAAGGVELKGTARPDAQIRLVSPDGTAIPAVADHTGAWELRVFVQEPRLYALADDLSGRLVRARGYIALLPPPGEPVVLLRPSAGPHALGGPRARPQVTAVDYDRGGAGVVSGLAAAGQVVRAQLDGADAGEGRSDAMGAFSVSLSEVLKPGGHRVTVHAVNDQGAVATAEAQFEVGPAPTEIKPPMTATRLEDAWRLDWVTPGGGVQTTIAFDTEVGG